ncbi:MAG: DNA mismatch repair endonuclease MutL [Paludibacteraceae bacterium]|nr:DNA mismatch repair endonuclease MutL [Paludibacteraceae bacterium]
MSDIIHLLPDNVANQIAAGEVIQRPASCLKELVENSLDAGATHVRILVKDGGRTLLQVIDNGKGMSPTDARMAFERHATSKIQQASDLFQLHTMGFRGEALASICAVAHVELVTRRPEDEVGTQLEITGSNVIKQEVVQCPIGTNIRVKNLFYNVPARRKFLKTDQTEMRNIITEYNRIALVNPHVQFTLVHNDEIISELPISTTKQRIENIFGHTSKPFTGQLVDVATNSELVNICGFVGKPEMASKNSQQFFFVNGRFMRHPYFHKAIITAYSGLIAADYTPSYFIYFDIQPDAIDVNIHPTKTEIKFADEQAIFQILLAAIREALGKFNITPSLDFTSEMHIEMPQASPQIPPIAMPKLQVDPSYSPFKKSAQQRQNTAGWEDLYTPSFFEPTNQEPNQQLFKLPNITESTPLVQWQNKYIIMLTTDGIVILHQHRVHTAILYKELLKQLQQQKGISQSLLFPDVLELSNEDINILQTLQQDLQTIGFAMHQLTPNAYTITAIPMLLENANPAETILQVIHQVQDTGSNLKQQWQETMTLALADRMAIPIGRELSDIEMRDLIMRFTENCSAQYLSNGQTIFTILTKDEIQKRF